MSSAAFESSASSHLLWELLWWSWLHVPGVLACSCGPDSYAVSLLGCHQRSSWDATQTNVHQLRVAVKVLEKFTEREAFHLAFNDHALGGV
jgi:hypothetical protein